MWCSESDGSVPAKKNQRKSPVEGTSYKTYLAELRDSELSDNAKRNIAAELMIHERLHAKLTFASDPCARGVLFTAAMGQEFFASTTSKLTELSCSYTMRLVSQHSRETAVSDGTSGRGLPKERREKESFMISKYKEFEYSEQIEREVTCREFISALAIRTFFLGKTTPNYGALALPTTKAYPLGTINDKKIEDLRSS
ncbi:hypothetical protein HHI36_002446 [Cryptolaemus montrouzieri]|uniref:Uncharacterized protein n=1 Tax=Cryptolaemus montrouzieri TaxID=559131 RepID=A0ABD2PB71_9CUCU